MRSLDDLVGIEVMCECPAAPDTGDRRGRVNEHSVHIKEKGTTSDLRHRLENGGVRPYLASQTLARRPRVFL